MSFLTRIETRAMYLLAPISPVLCSRWRFRRTFGRPLDLRTPRTLNEKLMWLKLRRYGTFLFFSSYKATFFPETVVSKSAFFNPDKVVPVSVLLLQAIREHNAQHTMSNLFFIYKV